MHVLVLVATPPRKKTELANRCHSSQLLPVDRWQPAGSTYNVQFILPLAPWRICEVSSHADNPTGQPWDSAL